MPVVQKKLHRINEEIRGQEVRLVEEEGGALGVVSLSRAMELALEKKVDLVELPNSGNPPVCKLIDYGKMLYALKKKEQRSRQASKVKEMKGIRLTFNIGEGDLDRWRKNSEEFLKDGHSIRIQLIMKGRERAHADLGFEKVKKFIESLSSVSRVEAVPKLSGSQIIAVLTPSKS